MRSPMPFEYIVFVGTLVLATVVANAASSPSGNLSASRENNQAIEALKGKDPDTAETRLIKALGADPFNPILHLNLGWVFESEKKYDMAVREYESILQPVPGRTVSDRLKFIAHFNAGNALAENKNVAGALEQYQAALDLNPGSKETKTNIELLFKGGQGQGSGSTGNKKNKDNSNNGKNQAKNPNQNFTNKGNPKPQFNSKDLTREDVRKILQEVQSEEQRVRAREYEQQTKDSPPQKDW